MSDNKKVNFIVRQMKESDCEELCKLCTLVDFRENIYANFVFLKIDPEGMFVAQDPNSGRILGSCFGVNLSPDLAFIGQYAVVPEYQGLGIGTALWNAWKDHVGPNRNTSLHAAPLMYPRYRDRVGFSVDPKKRQNCYTGKPNCNELVEAMDGVSVLPINDHNIEKVIQYDKEVCDGLDRTRYIRELLKIGKSANAVALSPTNEVLGYCVISPTNANTGIVEPLYANDEKIAELLLRKCWQSSNFCQTNGIIDFRIWTSNKSALSMAKKMGLKEYAHNMMLFTKKEVEGNMNKIFCTSTSIYFPF